MTVRQYRVLCDRCGFKYYNHQLKNEWTGLMVCAGPGTNKCWEPRHTQDFLRARKENQKLPFTRPEPADTFIGTCSLAGKHNFSDIGQADCVQLGFTQFSLDHILKEYICRPTGHLPQANLGQANCMTLGKTN